jgi:hypothetical protein
VACLATQTPGRVLDLGPLTEGSGPTSSPGSLLAPRVSCRYSSVGFDRQQVHRPAGLPAMGQGSRRREEGEHDGTYARQAKIEGAWVKKELKLILPKVKSKTFEKQFCSTFQDIHFLFYDYVHLSNA